ncbi:MAG TPA: hypothetical protein VK783_14720 [Bacteroidia bacterium]|jgi:hypothetical protein|nr:hypothetical protein [Bacteroidia bacterium]
MAQKKPNPHSRKTRYQLFTELKRLKSIPIIAVQEESKGQGTQAEQLARSKKQREESIKEVQEEFNKRKPGKNECSVFVVNNVYDAKPPYTGGIIIWKEQRPPANNHVRVKQGSYEECVSFMNEKCKS